MRSEQLQQGAVIDILHEILIHMTVVHANPNARPTLEDLLARVHRHYPRGIDNDDPRHALSEESRRLMCVREAAARKCGWNFYEIPAEDRVAIDAAVEPVVEALSSWRRFAASWKKDAPDMVLWDESNPWLDACYRYSALKPGCSSDTSRDLDEVVLAVSILAPVYVVYTYIEVPGQRAEKRYAEFPSRYQARVDRLSALAEENFGFHRLDESTVLTSVSDVIPHASNRCMSETTLMECLFLTFP